MAKGIKLTGLSVAEVAQVVPPGTVLLGYRGSIAHGLYMDPKREESIDDKDILGVCIPNIVNYFGLERFEQKEVFLREWDSVVYEFRKFVSLLCKGNPNVLSLLWLEPQHYLWRTQAGDDLVAARDLFVTKRVYHAFTGYAYGQLKRMTHFKFEGYMGDKRRALVEKFGYDTKNAAHLIRILRMGIEFLNEGRLYVHRCDAQQLLEIKRGEWTLDRVKAEADYEFKRAQSAYDGCALPNEPDRSAVNALCVRVLSEHFSGLREC